MLVIPEVNQRSPFLASHHHPRFLSKPCYSMVSSTQVSTTLVPLPVGRTVRIQQAPARELVFRPSFVHAQSTNHPILCKLPKELQDEIVSALELHRDLVSLALSCQALYNLVVPRHSEYRILRVRHAVPAVWAHLARRKDLARNIRLVSICKRSDYTSTDHWPSKLIDKEKDEKPEFFEEGERVKNICQALENMVNLTHFDWSGDLPVKPAQEDAILEVLAKKEKLKYLSLIGEWGRHARGTCQDSNSDVYPLWRIKNLTTLILRGSTWIKPLNAPHLVKMLSRSPQLEKLLLPMEFTKFPECQLPQLKSLSIPLLGCHPTLEELFWVPMSSETSLTPGSLPKLETLIFQFLDPIGLSWLQHVDKTSVKKASFAHYDGISFVNQFISMFPHLTHLHVGMCHKASPAPLAAWVKIILSLPNIQVFRGSALWDAVNQDKDRMHLVIMELVQKCPNLRMLDHCQRHARRNHDVQRIRIIREPGEDGTMNVSYVIEKPPPRYGFRCQNY
ncbi:hypothetical protein DL96DRAFT_1605114 [Flagelloscypha sp. PMI_526]|nr:hypothetical protein DL96DRAFT_1605114 [Flagelloscypha sp. PMI_526]